MQIRPIKTKADHRAALKEIERLMDAKPGTPAGDRLEILTTLVDHYESQTDDDATAEDQKAFESTTHTAMEVPVELVPEVRQLIAKRRAG